MPPDPIADPQRLAVVAATGLIDAVGPPLFDELARTAARLLDAPFAFVTLVDDERSHWLAAHGVDDGTSSNAVEESFCQYVIRSRDDLLVDDASVNPITCENPSIESMNVRAWAGCPVIVSDQVVGSFCVVDTVPRQWTDRDLETLQAFRDMAARELDRRGRPDRDSDDEPMDAAALGDLRAELIPPQVLDLPGFDIATWYRSATFADGVLGDFYDVFRRGDDRWGVVLGDVCGHGVEAARKTATLRYSLRAAATRLGDPAQVLADIDLVWQRDPDDAGRFATVVYVAIDPADGDGVVRASAGHPPIAVRRATGAAGWLHEANGSPIGIASSTHYAAVREPFVIGDLMLLYSDGATDVRDAHRRPLGESGLLDLVASAPADDAATFIAHVAAGIERHHDGRLGDDIALLALRRL